jgi:hypothetical protein
MNKYNSVQELFLSTPTTILLVGNGDIENKGELIDSFDYVIRFNDFKISGFEQHVGKKISAVSLHCSDFSFKHSKYLEDNYSLYKESVPIFTTSPKYSNSKDDILHIQSGTKLLDVSIPIMLNPNIGLSSGATLALNLALFFQKEIFLIGFNFFLKSGHYYDKDFTNEFYSKNIMGKDVLVHNGEFERQILTNIKNIKIID